MASSFHFVRIEPLFYWNYSALHRIVREVGSRRPASFEVQRDDYLRRRYGLGMQYRVFASVGDEFCEISRIEPYRFEIGVPCFNELRIRFVHLLYGVIQRRCEFRYLHSVISILLRIISLLGGSTVRDGTRGCVRNP